MIEELALRLGFNNAREMFASSEVHHEGDKRWWLTQMYDDRCVLWDEADPLSFESHRWFSSRGTALKWVAKCWKKEKNENLAK